MNCVGHVIRVWGRPPFNPGGPVPPPLRPGELFWQNLFKQPQVYACIYLCMLHWICNVLPAS